MPHHAPARPAPLLTLALAALALAGVSGCEDARADTVVEVGARAMLPPPPAPADPPPLCDGPRFEIASDIAFAHNDHTVHPEMARDLAECAPVILEHLETEGSFVLLTASCDGTGSTDYNLDLSNRRAESVKAILVAAHVPAGAIVAVGIGEEGAVDDIADASRRRVLVEVLP